MANNRGPKTEAQRIECRKEQARRRSEAMAAEDEAIEARVKKSLALFGP